MTNNTADTKTPENTTPDTIQIRRRELEVMLEALNDLSGKIANSKMGTREQLELQIHVMRVAQYWAARLD